MSNPDLTAIILTKNEELNIRRCIESVKQVAKRIIVVDSFSTDNTIDIARELGAEIYSNRFIHYANQFNWALDNIEITSEWIYRIDADEVVTEELAEEINMELSKNMVSDINGFVMKFKIYFMGKFLKFGDVYPIYNLTIFRNGYGRYENRSMGEHIVLSSGEMKDLENDCIHYDFKNLESWVLKHVNYALREKEDYIKNKEKNNLSKNLYHEAKKIKYLRDGFYYKLPKFFRASMYFLYRYVIKFGFLDGRPGLVYAFLQAFWYRFLVDSLIFEDEIKKRSEGNEK